MRPPPGSTRTDTLFPYTTLCRSEDEGVPLVREERVRGGGRYHENIPALINLRSRDRRAGAEVAHNKNDATRRESSCRFNRVDGIASVVLDKKGNAFS